MSWQRAKGTKFETQVAEYLSERLGVKLHRLGSQGANDKGDVWGLAVRGRDVTVECKNCKRMELSGWVDEAARESANAGTCYSIVIHKRRGRGDKRFGETYVTMTLDSLVELLKGE